MKTQEHSQNESLESTRDTHLSESEINLREQMLFHPDQQIHLTAQLTEVLIAQNKMIQAKAELEKIEHILVDPDAIRAMSPWLARKFFELGSVQKAEVWCDKAIEHDRLNPLLQNLAGCIALACQDTKKALEAFASELRIEPNNARTHLNISVALRQARSHERALHHLERAKNIDPENFTDLTGLYYVSSILMDLNRKEAYGEELLNNYSNKLQAKDPFAFFMLTDAVEKIRIANENYSSNYRTQEKKFAPVIFPKTHLKIGYASCDFKEHATAFLMRDLLATHNRANVEIIGLDFSVQNGSGFQKEFQSRFDQRIDISSFSDSDSARLIREMDIDVLIDLKGYTEGARPGIFFRRPCRVQVNFLGYPGTMGSLAHDFIIGDSIITPEHLAHGYTEAVVELSCCYQPNDPDRIIGSESSRETHALPEDTFIFCSFNYHKKLNRPTLESWGRILNRCPDSILWVLGTDNDPRFIENLESCGISKSRVILAPKLSMPNHVERLRHASVFLDSFPCGAHTTASDALFSGIPVITIQGQAFHSRVASSIMTFAGAPECVAESIHEYEQIAHNFYENPSILKKVNAKLIDKNQPLSPYNTTTLATQLEAAFKKMVEQEVPAPIKIERLW